MMRALATLLLLLLCASAAAAAAKPLQHVRVDAPDAPALATRLLASGFDVLEGSVSGGSLEVVASEASLGRLRAMGLDITPLATGRPFREIQAEGAAAAVPTGYKDLAGVIAQMSAAADSFPAICRFVNLTTDLGMPQTFEGRDLHAVKISDNVTADEDEPAFLMVSAHHCREIVTPVIALFAIDQLTSLYGSDPTVTNLVDTHEIWIAPVWNPDGYEHVFNVDNLWRKNRHVFGPDIGVDLNRNYPQGWTNACSGSTVPSSDIYKGPSAASEAETLTMIALAQRERFAKVLDYHSSGQEVLHGYACWSHPFDAYFQAEATMLSTQAGYAGSVRPPSADGEHYEWQFGTRAAYSFLMETATTFQPSLATALNEAAQVWPGTVWMLQRPVPLWGHVTDALTGLPLAASVDYAGVSFAHGETNGSDPGTGRYHAFLPTGVYDIVVSAPGYTSQTAAAVGVDTALGTELDFALTPIATAASVTEEPGGTRILFADPLRRTVRFELGRAARSSLRIYDVRGAQVAQVVDERRAAGTHQIAWDGHDSRGVAVPAGTYFYRLRIGKDDYSGKFVQVR